MSAQGECENANNLSRQDWEKLIDSWVFSERDRGILKRRLLDGLTYDQLSEEFFLSPRQIKRIVYKAQEKLFIHTSHKVQCLDKV